MVFDPVAYINEPRWMASRPGLERVTVLLDQLGNPQDTLRFVHVAGTNGKGSTCAFLSSILQKAGYKTGLFTSPHILEFSDRIRIDGQNIPDDELYLSTLAVREVADAMEDHPTEFELMTAVALLYFARQNCDIVVFEVGLGGRLDATNVIKAAEVCTIASIDFDHVGLLGSTLTEIAQEKAGIIKPQTPVVSWPQETGAMNVIEQVVREKQCTLRIPDFSSLTVHPVTLPGRRSFDYGEYKGLSISLMASYQPYNATLAIETVKVLRDQEWSISDEALREGLAEAKWPGRFEVAGEDPTFIIDGAHNAQGAMALAASLSENYPDRRPVFIVGVLEDKDYSEMLEAVVPYASAFAVIEPPSPRAVKAENLVEVIHGVGGKHPECLACADPYVAKSISDAIIYAKARAIEEQQRQGHKAMVCAFGSLYSIGAIKAALDSAR